MNLKAVEDLVFSFIGKQDVGNRLNWRRQRIRDGANAAVREIVQSMPWTWQQIQEFTLDLVAGQSVYGLDDSVRRPLFAWYEGQNQYSQQIRFVNYERSTYDGERGSSSAFSSEFGPWHCTWAPRTTTAEFSTTVATQIADDAVSQVVVADTPDADHVGRILRIGGDGHEYEITAVNTGAKTYTLHRKIRSRMDDISTGLNTDQVGPVYAVGAKVDVGPKGRYQLRFLPQVDADTTINYSAIVMPKALILPDEEPDIPEEHHHLVWKGAVKHCALFNQDDKSWQMYANEYAQALEAFKKIDVDTMPSNDPPRHGSILQRGMVARAPNDYQSRRYPGL